MNLTRRTAADRCFDETALKHYTSKLKDYSDLDSVSTFGFRGEALSSLCALSDVTITTARDCDAPKGVKLVFESSGKLKSQTVVAAAKGTAVCSLNLFKTLPVRRKEMERNIKREYTKVLGILQAYASVCVGVKFSIFNQPSKGYVKIGGVERYVLTDCHEERRRLCLQRKGIRRLGRIFRMFLDQNHSPRCCRWNWSLS